ncbi:MAG: AAA family ATPase [Acidimicrobiales bacterium]|nr:AAA family ATPase [Acidimicrobiales bacterium]
MTERESDVIEEALSMQCGARFVRCALQVNPHHYAGTYRSQPNEGSLESYAAELVAKAQENDIGVLAVTDHNCVRDVPVIQQAAAGSGVVVLPGFELASSDGIHVLCIYPADRDQDTLVLYLGAFGITDPEPSSSACKASFGEILNLVADQGGIAISAHIDGKNGLLAALKGQARIAAWRHPNLLAAQIPARVEDLPLEAKRIVTNKNAQYARERPAGNELAVAVINACDVIHPDQLGLPSASCWIKMSEPRDVEGLRQAFLDPESRVRLNTDEQPPEHYELEAIAWECGFLDGSSIHFNPNLNALIGGRGAGKSTVVESIRYALDLEPVGDDASSAHKDIVRHVLHSGTKISMLVRSLDPSERRYRIERTVPNPPIVRDDLGQVSSLRPADILPRVEVFGQHEISELTRSAPKLTVLLRRFVQTDAGLHSRKTSIQRELKRSRKSLLEAEEELDSIDERLAALPQLEERLTRFEEAGLEERLSEQSLLVRESRVVDSIGERLQPLRDALSMLREELPLDRAFVSERALADLPGAAILDGVNPVLQRISEELEGAAGRIEQALVTADEQIGAITTEWSVHKSEIDARYESILRELQKSSVDGEEFIRLRRNIEGLRPLEERRAVLLKLRAEEQQRRRNLLDEWENIKAAQFRELRHAAKKVNKRLKGYVRVDVRAASDRTPLTALLRAEIGGRLDVAIRELESIEDLSLTDLVAVCRNGATELAQRYGITKSQAESITGAGEQLLMQVEELELPPTTQLLLNTAGNTGDETWQTLRQLSKGQQATAVLLLLLLDSDAPLIVDQPEDDLDNRFISEVIVGKMRESKRRRQFVFSTHNANIPVLGDAELIVGLDARGDIGSGDDLGQAFISPTHMGSIDNPPVRALVEEILEGGKTAFERRRRKYGF